VREVRDHDADGVGLDSGRVRVRGRPSAGNRGARRARWGEQWIPIEELGDDEDYSLISIPDEYAPLEAVEDGYTVTLNNVAYAFASFDTAAQALYTYHGRGELPKSAAWIAIIDPMPPAE
jgi:hypothetical protein